MTLKEEYKLLTLKEIKRFIEELENDLEYFLAKKEILFNKTQPSAVDYSKDSVQGGKRANKYDDYVASIEELDINENIDKIYCLLKINQDWYDKKLEILGEYEPLIRKIIELRENDTKWELIAGRVGYSARQCQRYYDKYLKREKKRRTEI